jgi:hypothetical protein
MTIQRHTAALLSAAAILAVGANASLATVILAPGSSWEYTTDGGATWQVGNAPFGNVLSGDFGYATGTYWPAYGSLEVKTTLDLTGFDLSTISWDLGVDNGFALSVNGNPVAADNAEGYTSRWEYSGMFPAADLHSGLNLVDVVLEDHGGLTAFDMQISGRQTNGVPDAASSLQLLGFALLGLGAIRNRLSR